MPDEVRYEVAPDGDLIIHVPMQWKKSSRRTLAVAPDAPTTDTPLAKAVGRALALHEEFERGDYPTLRAMAMAHGIDPDCVTHASNLALVSPRILKAIATGRSCGRSRSASSGSLQPDTWRRRTLTRPSAEAGGLFRGGS